MKKRNHKRYMLSVLFTIICNCLTLSYAQHSNASAALFTANERLKNSQANDVDGEWYSKAKSYILQQGFLFKSDALNRNYAVNQPQKKGYFFNRLGFTVSPMLATDKPNSDDDWNIAITVNYIGKGTNLADGICNYNTVKTGNKLDVLSNNFKIEYVNNEAGLRQNFIVYDKPAGNDDLTVKLTVDSKLNFSGSNNSISFSDEKGSIKLYYRDLKVWDANNQLLQASMSVSNPHEIVISVDDKNAVYPVTIDPLTQTPELTTSADGILPALVGQLAVNAAYGFSVAGLGDINGDGFDDVAVGAPALADIISGSGSIASVGGVFVYYGSITGLPTTPGAKLQPTTLVAGSLFGFSVAGGDITGDGKNDILVGAPLDNLSIAIGGGQTATGKVGKAYVFNGATLSTTTSPLITLLLSGTGILENNINLSVKALFGFSVSVTDDLNGDGKKDMIVGAPAYAGITTGLLGNSILDVQSGGAFVFLTAAGSNTTTLVKLEPYKQNLLGLGLLTNNINGLLFGYAVDGAGDYNSDGKADVVATAPAGIEANSITGLLFGKVLQGSALVYYGTGTGVNKTNGAILTATSGGLLDNLVGSLKNVANLFGTSVKGIKTTQSNRNGSVIVGAPLGGTLFNILGLNLKTGTVNVFKKKTSSPSGYVPPDQVLSSPRNDNNILSLIQANILFGFSLDNVYDINCDGISDIVVGEPVSSGLQLLNANVAGGASYIYLGKSDGTFKPVPVWSLTVFQDAFLGVNATSLVGYSVAGAGRVKGPTGSNRVLVGSPSRTLDFGSGLLNLGSTFGTLFSLVAGNNGVGKAFLFDTKLCVSLSLSGTDPKCAGAASGSITATFSDGAGPYMIKINGGAYVSQSSPYTFTNLSAGTHTISVMDANGSETTKSFILTDPALITTSVTIVHPLCPGQTNGSLSIMASGGTGALTYSKDGGITFQASNSFTGLGAGSYNWVVKDANGCTKTGTAVTVNPTVISAMATPVNPSRFAGNDGSFIITASGGTGGLTYSKDGGTNFQASNSFTGLTCVSYNWVVKDANGCMKTGTVTLVCPPDIIVNNSKTDPSCFGSPNGSFTLAASGGVGTFTYSKDGGTSFQASNTFTGLVAGSYNWVVKDANGYTKTGTIILVNPAAITANATPTNPLCNGGTGSFAITAGGGTGTLTYSKDGGTSFQASNTFTSLAAGNYNWVVKDANGCTKTGTVVITAPAAITASATFANPTGAGASDGSFNITANGGTGTLTYSKDGGITFQASNLFTGLTCGTYSWVVKDANGCTKPGTVGLTCPAAVTATASPIHPLCNGSTGSFSIAASGGVGTFTYSKDGGTSFQTSNNFTGLLAGNYNWVVKDANGYTKTGTIILVNPAAITASATPTNPLCNGGTGSFAITAGGGTGTLTYSRDGGTSFQASNTFTGLTTGSYNWVVKDANGCTKTGTVAITAPAAISASATFTNPTGAGASDGSFNITANGGTGTLTYSKDGGTTFQASNLFNGLTCGTYNWVVKDANGCTKPGTVTLTCPAAVTATATPIHPLCNGGTGSFSIAASGGVGTFTYSKDGGTIFQASNTFTGLAAGSYNWVVKDANGYTKTGTIILVNPAAITASASPTNPLCNGGTGSFAITAGGGTGTLTYSRDGGTSFQASNTFTGLTTGSYNWVVKDANGCTKTGTVTVVNPAAITASATFTNPGGAGASDGSFNITATGGTGTLTYSKDGGTTFQSSNTFSGLTCGTYNWVIKDVNGCTKAGTVSLTCPALITVNVNQSNPSCNGSTNGSFTLTASGGTGTLTYSKNGGSTFQASNNFTGLAAGSYNWVVKDANGYTKTGTVTLDNPAAITASATPTNPLCNGGAGSFAITAGGGTGTLTYSKDGGTSLQASNTFTALTTGSYNWVVKDANGCTKTGTVTITNPAAITASATFTNPTGAAASDGSFNITANGGTGTLTYSKDGGTTFQASNSFTGLTCVSYNWVVKDVNGCTKAGTVSLTCPAVITVNVNQSNPSCNGSTNGSITLTASGGTGTLTYSKDGGTTFQASNNFTGLLAGSYNWVVKDANGYTKTGTIILVNPAAITANAIPTNPLCNGGTGSFAITAGGGTGTLTFSRDGGTTYQASNTFTSLAAGNYNWVVKDANSCTKTGTVAITAPAAISASATFTNPTGAGASDGSFNITASGGTGTFTYSKDGGTSFQASNLFTGLTCGTYNWVVKDANGCTKAGTVSLTCPAIITVNVNQSNPSCNGGTGSFSIAASGGIGTFTYSKDGGTTFQASNTFTGLAAGSYNWVVKDANGYTKTGTVTLVNPAAITASASPTNPLCNGGSGSFSITASGGTGSITYSRDGGTSFQASNTFTGLTTSSYNWVVKDANGCTKTGTVAITNPAAITASATFTNPTGAGASDGSFNITASGGAGTLTYSKDGGTTFQASKTFTGLTCGTYSWVVKDANGCTKAGTVSLTCPVVITVNVNQSNPSCNGSTNGSFTLTASGGTGTFTYSRDGGTTFQASNTFTGLAAGSYNWVVKDANGYTKTATIILVNPAAITALATLTNPLCNGGTGSFSITASGGTGTFTYSKDGGTTFQASNTFTSLAAGNYNWVVKDANGCTKTGTATITSPAAITASATFTNPTGAGASDGSFTITGSGGTGTLTYSKDGGTTFQASNLFTSLTCGTYNWVVKDANGCTKPGTVGLTCPALITVNINQSNPSCNGSTNGSFTLTASGGTGTLTYSKDGGITFQASNNFTGLLAGSYNWVVKDANGYTKAGTVSLLNPAAITASATPTKPLCNGGIGSFIITASGGTGTLTYSKDGGTTFQASNSFTNLTTGNYNWVVKDANGCTKTGTATITSPAPITASATFTNPTGAGTSDGSFNITASGGTGTLTYSKDGGTTFQASNTFTGLTCGTYSWVVKDANGCTKAGTVSLTCPAIITVNVNQSNPSCNGSTNGSFSLTASGGTGTLTYSKDGGTTFQASNNFTGLLAGSYNWVVKDANGYTKAGTVTLLNPAVITASATPTNPLCNGGTGSFAITAGGGTGTLTYSKDGGTSFQASNTFTGLTTGSYNWVVKDANGCTKTGAVTITSPAAITASATFTNPTGAAASDGSFNITATGGTGTLTYSKDGGTTFQSSNTFSGLTCGTYNWVVKDANGCTKAGTVGLTCPAAVTATATPIHPLCNGGTGSFSIAASGGVGTFTYSKDGTTFQASNTFTGLAAGSYNWVIKDANGYTKAGTVTLVNPAAITASATPTNPLCNGGTGSFAITAGGGTGTFTYSKDGGTSFQASNTFTSLAAGNYNWVVKDANGCTKTGTATITAPAAITASATFTNPTGAAASDGSFNITANGGTGTLTYSKDGGTTFQSSNTFSGLTCGTYNWVVKDVNGCTKAGTVSLTCPALITVNVNQSNPSCNGSTNGSFTLTASGGTGTLTYSKDGGTTFQVSNNFTGLVAGSYNWVIKDANGYTKAGTVTLVNPAAINASATPIHPLCNGGTGSFAITAGGGTGTITYSRDGGTSFQSSNTFTSLAAGNYNWVVKDANGCTKTGTVIITSPATISASATFINPLCFGGTGSFTITASGGAGSFTYSKDGGTSFQASNAFTGLAAGTYNWVAKDAKGCTKTGTIAITAPAAINASIAVINPEGAGATDGSFTITASGGTGTRTYSKNGGTTFQASNIFSGLTCGNYNWVVKDANGCTKTGSATMNCPTADGTHIFPTSTTCSDYSTGTQPLAQLCYTAQNGAITNVTPGVFFYYTSVTAPSASFCIDVAQRNGNGFTNFDIAQGNQMFLFDGNCNKVATGSQTTAGRGRVCITNAVPGARYVLSVKYDSKSVIGTTFTGTAPTVNYYFDSRINGTIINNTSGFIKLVPNCSASTPLISQLVTTNTGDIQIFEAKIAPNPSASLFRLYINTSSREVTHIRLTDLAGRMISSYKTTSPYLELGQNLIKGMYFIEITQGNFKKVIKVEKL